MKRATRSPLPTPSCCSQPASASAWERSSAKLMLRPKKTYAALSGKRVAATSTLNQSEVSGTASVYGSRLGQMRRCGRSAGTSKELGDEGKTGSGRRLMRRPEV